MTRVTTNRPYPTIDEKIQLFKEHGIDVKQCLDDDNEYKQAQAVKFSGNNEVAQRVEDLANQHDIAIMWMSCEWWYDSKPSPEPPQWFVIFSDTFSNFRR